MEELDLWQKENGVVLPENYKEWLLLSKYSYIAGGVLELFMPSKNGYYGQLVPEEFIVVGNVIGDGERLCFDVNMGEFVRYDHGYIREVGDFTNILNWAIEYLEIMLEAVNDKIRFVFRNDLLRRKAIQGFWIHERELLNNGSCTRQWNGDEIEAIYNINLDTGNKRIYAGKPVQYKNGEKLTDENGTPVRYEGHHMMSYQEHPEYIGEWKNIQALTPEEHILGAHGQGKRG